MENATLNRDGLTLLGLGGRAAVYALDEARVLKKYSTADEFLQRETLVYERLGRHSNIAKYFGSTADGIVLERGECLRNVLRQRGKNSKRDSEKLNWAIQAAGLAYMHSLNVVHADVGPHNLILVDANRIKWLDFEGSGIDNNPATSSYDIHYWRPTEGDPSIATDIFAFGCLLFEIETGRPPYSDSFGHLQDHEKVREIERLYAEGRFPDITGFHMEQTIFACWNGQFENMVDVSIALSNLSPTASWRLREEPIWKCVITGAAALCLVGYVLRVTIRRRL